MNQLLKRLAAVFVPLICLILHAEDRSTLPGTTPLTMEGDMSAQMVAGIDRFLTQETSRSIQDRKKHWQRDFSSVQAYEKSVEPNRERLRKIIGAVDPRVPMTGLEVLNFTGAQAKVAETESYTVYAVRWPVFEGVFGEGLWLQPKSLARARIIAIPDADQTPEMLVGLAPGLPPENQFARRLAEHGCEVLVPVLLDRTDRWSGSSFLKRFTNQPHREWIYRQAYELGRHVIGYEVQKVLAAVDWFEISKTKAPAATGPATTKIGLAGYAEGGLIAFYAAALDPRIDATLVSGYFDSRERVWAEPIYRNVFGLLEQFGDAELASLVAPRHLIVEHSLGPKVDGPPKPHEGRGGAAPGKLTEPDFGSVEKELSRARELVKGGKDFDHFEFVCGNEGMTTGPASDRALAAFLNALGTKVDRVRQPAKAPVDNRQGFDPGPRQQRQVKELEEFTQTLLRRAHFVRNDFFWRKLKVGSPQEWEKERAAFQTNFWDEVIGHFPPSGPLNPRSRRIEPPTPKSWTEYEVVLDVLPEVFAWGYLLLPNDLKPGEKRPVVVCQHGLEGVPGDTVTEDEKTQGFGYYKGFSARLADRGFVVFAPHNPYRGGDRFRVLQRKANPLGKSLFSVIIAQHERILDWLAEQPFVDANRIGFYGLSYGGKTAMRVPAALNRYALSICSADFNEWIWKNAMVDFPICYLFGGEYEMPEFNLGMTYNYAEIAALIAPRPFMVERGHNDGVGIDEWVAYEFARVKRLYDGLGIGDKAQLEVFTGPHTINGKGTFDFLQKNLNWEPPAK